MFKKEENSFGSVRVSASKLQNYHYHIDYYVTIGKKEMKLN